MQKLVKAVIFTFFAAGGITGCNTMPQNSLASACEQGIARLNAHLHAEELYSLNQVSLSRANSLLQAAQVQHQFAEYPGCVEKVKRAQSYLSGTQAAIVSRLSI